MIVDANQLELALLNVALNARDAMPDGGRFTISAEEISGQTDLPLSPGDYVRIRIVDTGVGMDEATRAKATEPFFTTKGPGMGTGLGLSVVHGIAVQSGGWLRIDSAPNVGTTVELWLPQSIAYSGSACVSRKSGCRCRRNADRVSHASHSAHRLPAITTGRRSMRSCEGP